ncbi:hypothetical protein E2C01_013515 [Portunus trituberculatus]|uniref:Uncharacterized protein n=1 Tax=Portunus trituberculatus TaxID=210409 RepID=A0A5B7DHB3_PORTR|nr:hypothetical protein [Portunus trituberculatus]
MQPKRPAMSPSIAKKTKKSLTLKSIKCYLKRSADFHSYLDASQNWLSHATSRLVLKRFWSCKIKPYSRHFVDFRCNEVLTRPQRHTPTGKCTQSYEEIG